MGEIAKRKHKTNIIIKCKLAVCTAIFLMMTTSLNVSAEVVGGTESVQEDTEISTADIESGVVGGEGESVESGNSEAESTESGSTEEGSTEEGSTEEGSTEEGSTEEGSTEEGSTEEGSTEEESTEEGSTEEGSTEEESTEEGSTEEGSTEEGSTEEESTEEESTEEGSTEEGSTEESTADQGAEEELVPPPLENIVLTTMPDTRNTVEEALRIECEALGLICNGTSIIGYDASKIGDVLVIPEGITTITGMAGMPASEVIFPASLMEIGSSCFMGSPNLRKISFKSGSQIYAIFMSAFYDCPNLETTDFSNTDFVGHPSDGSIMVRYPFGGSTNVKYIFFSQTGLENLKNAGGIRFFDYNFNHFNQFTLRTDGTVSSEAELCTFWKSGIADMITLGLNLKNVKKAAVIFNGSEYDITKRLQTQNIAEAYSADNLGSQEQDLLWSSCFTESTAKTATNLVDVSAVGSAADGLHYSSFTEFYKNLLKEGNKDDLTVELQNEIAGVFSSVVTTLVTKTQAIPKTVQDFNIDRVTVQKT